MLSQKSSDVAPTHRMASYKNRGLMKADELRRRREDVTVEIRKQKKEESLSKRRNMSSIVSDGSDDEGYNQSFALEVNHPYHRQSASMMKLTHTSHHANN
jgi:hypothetical protein